MVSVLVLWRLYSVKGNTWLFIGPLLPLLAGYDCLNDFIGQGPVLFVLKATEQLLLPTLDQLQLHRFLPIPLIKLVQELGSYWTNKLEVIAKYPIVKNFEFLKPSTIALIRHDENSLNDKLYTTTLGLLLSTLYV